MTHSTAPDHPARTRALKLLQLARRGVGGERANATRLLLTHLQANDMTLFDIDPGLPVTQDLSVLDSLREAQLELAKLGTDRQDEALDRLVDDPTLTPAEIERVLSVMDLHILARHRTEAWAHLDGVEERQYAAAVDRLDPRDLQAFAGSVAQRAHAAVRQAHWRATYPLRTLRVQGEVDQALVAGILSGLGAIGIRILPDGVEAHLNGDQLARARSMMVHDLPGLRRQATEALRGLGEQHARKHHG
ncbi:hypothetical protein [Deinococcus daejeonensis]|uniref:DUF2336 domain-containing protein n=1 Tax=Deinococcus daejeonensis TaxID=1007098 RepID=A0ABQ2JJE1_9DEIO|nr:hypothetical protein [Deinococcus daejeonensis]GGN46449.1 hypothetical protein GCM10010842_36990 [Deinococcus daejeonensis]